MVAHENPSKKVWTWSHLSESSDVPAGCNTVDIYCKAVADQRGAGDAWSRPRLIFFQFHQFLGENGSSHGSYFTT